MAILFGYGRGKKVINFNKLNNIEYIREKQAKEQRAKEKEKAQQKQSNFETFTAFASILLGVALQFIILIIILSKY